MRISVWALTAFSLVYAEDLQAPESLVEEPSRAIEVVVDAAAELEGSKGEQEGIFGKMSKKAAKMILLSAFDTNKDGCIDQAEYGNLIVLNPLNAFGKVEGPEAWALSGLQQGRLDAKHVAPYKWCPFNKKQSFGVVHWQDDDEEFDNPRTKINITGKLAGCAKTDVRESHYMKESCRSLVNHTLDEIWKQSFKNNPMNYHEVNGTWKAKKVPPAPPLWVKYFAEPFSGAVADMCRILFPGPCVRKPIGMTPYLKTAFAAMEAVSSSGWISAKIPYSIWSGDYDETTKIYSPAYTPATPEEAYKRPELHCGKNWTGKYYEKNSTIPNVGLQDFIPGTASYSPLTMFLMMYSLTQTQSIDAVKLLFNVVAPVEVAVYSAHSIGASKGVCIVAWQETQEKPKGGDWQVNLAADLVAEQLGSVKGRAHRGMVAVFNSMKDVVKARFDATECGDPSKVDKIIFVGYSAGGGMAAMNFAYAKKEWGLQELGMEALLLTAGAPPIGDIDFCEKNFNDGKTYQVGAMTDHIVTGEFAGDVGVIVMGLLQIHHCSKIHWISCPEGVRDCHSQDSVYSHWALNASDFLCEDLVGTGPGAPAPPPEWKK